MENREVPLCGRPLARTERASGAPSAPRHRCGPLVPSVTTPQHRLATARNDIGGREVAVPFAVPLAGQVWVQGCQVAILRGPLAGAVRAAGAPGSALDPCFPLVSMSAA